jgi:predicted nucleotide-binding protein (sugar kinase/HSP70/actin superfamily)
MRFSDRIAIEAQQKVFAKISENIEWKMETDVAKFERDLREMVREILNVHLINSANR